MKILLGLFLIAHGLLHASYLTPKPDDAMYPFSFDKGWFAGIAGSAAKPIGSTLAVIVIISFILAGLSIFGFPGLAGLWKIFTIIGAVSSLLLLALFWHPWLILGILINLLLLYGAVKLRWPFKSV